MPRRLRVLVAATTAGLMLAACGQADEPSQPRATLNPAPSAQAAQDAPGARALGDDPRSSDAGKPVDTVDWVTPMPADAGALQESPAECHQGAAGSELVTCTLGDTSGSTDVMVIGDSKTRQWVPALDIAARELGWRLTVATKTACPFTTAPTASQGATNPYDECDAWNKAALAKIKADKPDIVFNGLYKMRALRSRTDSRDAARERMVAGVRDAIGQVADTGARVVLMAASPMNSRNMSACAANKADQLSECATPRDVAFSPDQVWDEASVDEVTRGRDNVHVVDLNDYICPGDACVPVIGNVLVYRDKHHVTVEYMRTLAPMMESALKSLA